MIYTDLTRQAMRIAVDAHYGQTDKGGFPYIHHPLYVAQCMDDAESTAAALLHDVLEDTCVTAKELRQCGISETVVEAVETLTHHEGENYMDYIRRISTNPIAKRVKAADLAHNMDLSRMTDVTDEDMKRVEKYKRALEVLKQG